MMTHDPYTTIAHRLGGRLLRRWKLKGGVSANVQALHLAMSDGTTEKVVVRQHNSHEESVTSVEHALLKALANTDLQVFAPRMFDISGEVLSSPYLVLPFIEGTTVIEPAALPRALELMADFLVHLHELDVKALELPTLPHRMDPVGQRLNYAKVRSFLEILFDIINFCQIQSRSLVYTSLCFSFWVRNNMMVRLYANGSATQTC